MSESKGLTLYVAADGNDSNSGRTSEKPFATLERARDEIRKIKKADLPIGGITVELAEGIYQREQIFELTKDDSGTKNAPIVYKAKKGDKVRITGGKIVDNFMPVTDQDVLERLDPEVHGKVYQADLKALGITDYGDVNGGGLELFFNDKPMMLSRWPNEDFIKIVGLVGGDPVDIRGTKGDQIGKFMYEGDRPKRWVGEKDPWVHGYWFWDWSDQRHPVESIDTENHIISVKPPYHGYGYRIGQWFYALNILAELDIPNEWYLDRETGILYFYPPSPIENGQAVVSIQQTAINMNDVSYVTIEGMTFEATRGTAIIMSGGTGNRISDCTIRNLGSGITISGGTDNGVVGCDIYEIANGGISLSGGERTTLTPAGLFAENNNIYNYGRWNRMYQSAISIGGVGNRASNNCLHDAPHIAIMFGGNDHIMEYNEIYNVCYESNDAGAIYSGRDWTMRGTVIRYNYLHHINGFEGKGCVGVYLDDMYCGTLIYGNLFYKVTMAAFIGGGRDCTIENNIFIDCVPSIHIDARAMGWASDHVETTMTDRLNDMPYKNELWSKRYPELVGILEDEPAAPKGNLVTRNISVGGRWDGIYDEAKSYVTVKDNLVDEDPHFVRQHPVSFELKDDSPAYKLGFKKIPIEKIGLKR